MLRIVPYAALNFAAYERLRELLVEGLLPASSHSQPDGLRVSSLAEVFILTPF